MNTTTSCQTIERSERWIGTIVARRCVGVLSLAVALVCLLGLAGPGVCRAAPDTPGQTAATPRGDIAATARRTNQPLPLHKPGQPAPQSPGGKSSGRRPLRTVISSVSLVVGGFLLLVALFRTQLKRRLGMVPSAAVEVLGVVRLTARQQLHLVRLGPKLLLLNLAGGRVERVAEVSDPEEVELIMRSHRQGESGVVSHAMHDVLAHLNTGRDPRRDQPTMSSQRWEA